MTIEVEYRLCDLLAPEEPVNDSWPHQGPKLARALILLPGNRIQLGADEYRCVFGGRYDEIKLVRVLNAKDINMETKDIPATEVSKWQPITRKVDLAVLGKLGEEAAEMGSALFRCVIQGVDEAEPRTGKINRQRLMDEIADVEAMIMHAKRHFKLDEQVIAERRFRKYSYKMPWFESLDK